MDKEIHKFLLKHLEGIMKNDIASYHETTAEDLTLYEWWVTPHRLDGLPFHEFMMTSNESRGSIFGAEDQGQKAQSRFYFANRHSQRYFETAIASYTLLIRTALPEGVKVVVHNESRVMIKLDGNWKVVHVHKSPAYSAPHVAP